MNTNEYINPMNASRRNDRAKLNLTGYIKDHPIILTGAQEKTTKTLVEANGRIVDFPGIEPWTAERVRHIVGEQPKGFARYGISFRSHKDDLFTVYWTIQKDGLYSADEDGFGMTDDEKIVLFAHINGEGSFVNPFRLYERGGFRYYYGEKEMSPRPLFRYRMQSGYAGKTEISIDRCCENHEEVVIPESIHDIPVSKIDMLAFAQCENVRRIVLADTIDYIGSQAFDRCTALESIRMPARMAQRMLSSYMFRNCTSLRTLTIPDGVEGIGREAFNGCTSLTSVTIPEGVKVIGDYAFYDCASLREVILPVSVRSIGKCAFEGCAGLSEIALPEGLEKLGDWAFCRCAALERVEIPFGITAIGKSAFAHCKALKAVVLPEGVTKLDKWAFEDCGCLESLRLPENVTEIGKRAFADCAGLARVDLPMGLERVAPDAFAGCDNARLSPYPTTVKQGLQLATATIATLLAERKGE